MRAFWENIHHSCLWIPSYITFLRLGIVNGALWSHGPCQRSTEKLQRSPWGWQPQWHLVLGKLNTLIICTKLYVACEPNMRNEQTAIVLFLMYCIGFQFQSSKNLSSRSFKVIYQRSAAHWFYTFEVCVLRWGSVWRKQEIGREGADKRTHTGQSGNGLARRKQQQQEVQIELT